MVATRAPLGEVGPLAREIVERIVWATVTTVAADGGPRSRLMHPVWSWSTPTPTALVTARPTPIKRAHLAAGPLVSCFYWDPGHDTVAIDATATWLGRRERIEAWEAIASVAPPVGFDPAMIWPDGPDSPDCGILRFDAHRLLARPAGTGGLLWRRAAASGRPATR
jgi:hypothetical protein